MEVNLGLFLSAFLSATLLPGSSEVLLAVLLTEGYDAFTLWYWATAGNTLGSVVNWFMGKYLLHFRHAKWFPVKEKSLYKAQHWFQHYGLWSLLLAWAPVIGDGLTFVAGMMRVNFYIFLLLTSVAKGVRYLILLGLVSVTGLPG